MEKEVLCNKRKYFIIENKAFSSPMWQGFSHFIFIYFFKFYFIFKLYNIVLVLPNIEMNLVIFFLTFHFKIYWQYARIPFSSYPHQTWRIPGMGKPGGLPSMGSQSWTRLKRLSSSIYMYKMHILFYMRSHIWLKFFNHALGP